ncbi:23S rRNA (adenine(2503)-C(2))-methyltransferase RlmN, partial [Escherichia coli]|nr:23S rRNA (adenine(2503)-C(2))-methyltransferase RlmN [Escherichia coli]
INCVIRREHGTDIDAACGQLRSKQIKRVGVRERMKQKQAAAEV